MPFILTHNPHPQFVYPQNVFKQYLDDWLVSFKQQESNFF